MILSLANYLKDGAPKEMANAAQTYERKFGIKFYSLTYFSKELLDELHSTSDGISKLPQNLTIASEGDESILKDIEVLSEIANACNFTITARCRYYESLLSIYGKLPNGLQDKVNQPDSLCIGPEREGRILAGALECLPVGRSLCPQAKRIPYRGGLLIGLDEINEQRQFNKAVIIDGAIASGATIMAIIEKLRRAIRSFHIYSVHGTYEGLRALNRYCQHHDLNIRITVGHATDGLNAKFYATTPESDKRLVVGDLGDTISEMGA